MIITLFLLFFGLMFLLGVPLWVVMGSSSMISLMLAGTATPSMVVQRTYGMLDSYSLMAIPFFMLSGELMSKSGLSEAMVNFAKALVGHFRGGIAQVCIVSSMIFAGVSGSSTADASAIGAIILPPMRLRGYNMGWSAALQASAATMGPIIPPSMNMIVYGSMTGVSIGALFLGGVLPGIMIGLGLMLTVYLYSFRPGFEFLKKEKRATFVELATAFRKSALALMIPFIIIGGIVSGVFTATEAGVIASVYAFTVGFFVTKSIKIRDLEKIMIDAAKTSAMVLMIVAMAGAFGWILAFENFPTLIGNLLMSVSDSRLVIMLMVVAFLLIITMFVEALATLIIFVPVLYKISVVYNFDPIYFGVVVVISLCIGAVTPPVGVLLYVGGAVAKVSFNAVVRNVWWFIVTLITVLFVVTFIPPAVTFLPHLIMGK